MASDSTAAFAAPVVRMLKLSDEDVMERLRQGHPDALPILFDRFYRLVLKIALRILRDPGEAEDLMQDVFLEIFNKAAQFDAAKVWVANSCSCRDWCLVQPPTMLLPTI